jgi:hypothetical protein
MGFARIFALTDFTKAAIVEVVMGERWCWFVDYLEFWFSMGFKIRVYPKLSRFVLWALLNIEVT